MDAHGPDDRIGVVTSDYREYYEWTDLVSIVLVILTARLVLPASLVIANDVGAYFVGFFFGRHQYCNGELQVVIRSSLYRQRRRGRASSEVL